MVSSLNNQKTRLTGMKPVDAIKQTLVEQGFSQPVKEYEEKLLDVGTDPIWSVDIYKIKYRYVQKHQPTLYYFDSGPKRSLVFEELQPIHDP